MQIYTARSHTKFKTAIILFIINFPSKILAKI